ncbi:triose-phosphate transporter family-domain-containing protein [Hygrophoropsis aurantiaca]|uniref:Triose-phosphate transporter family-domain-containing protein n=1 Tax=Hygrophoropsis aurantiaca TaxID=72124 RepID=A0ACB8AHL6_9AGAM|nr:triose-phosphate transporter family-domain-containing protein [Hygrophoropsis aurantiaca]
MSSDARISLHAPLILSHSVSNSPHPSENGLASNSSYFVALHAVGTEKAHLGRSSIQRSSDVPARVEIPSPKYRPSEEYPHKSPIKSHFQNTHRRHESINGSRHPPSSYRVVSPTTPPPPYSKGKHPAVLSSPSDTRIPVYDPDLEYGKYSRTQKSLFYDSQSFWLVLYFSFNLGLTLYNKGVLMQFPFPYTLTALHALCGTIGGFVLLRRGIFVPAQLSDKDNAALIAFSVLYTINIAVSNLSLQLVTVPFHQVVRAATPIFTIILSACLFGLRSSRHKMASLIPVIAGVGLATYGDYYCTLSGLLLTVLGTLLAAVKTIFTSILQSSPSPHTPRTSSPLHLVVPPRLHLHPLDLLTRMAPLAFIQCVILAISTGELDQVRHYSSHEMTTVKAISLLLNGIIAFGLNVVSFTANKKAGPLSMTVAANVKQVLSIFLAVLIFDLSISATNAMGILLTLAGGAWYATIEYQEKQGKHRM